MESNHGEKIFYPEDTILFFKLFNPILNLHGIYFGSQARTKLAEERKREIELIAMEVNKSEKK